MLADGVRWKRCSTVWPGTALKVVTKRALPLTRWSHVTVDLRRLQPGRRGSKIYVNGEANGSSTVVRDKICSRTSPRHRQRTRSDDRIPLPRQRLQGWRVRRSRQSSPTPLSPLEIATLAGRTDFDHAWQTPPAALTPAQRAGLREYYSDPRQPSRAGRGAGAQGGPPMAQNTAVQSVPEAIVMEELPEPKPAYILVRGAYDAPKTERRVTATRSAELLPPFPADAPRNRLGLARWLTRPDHPLMARVYGQPVVAADLRPGPGRATPDNFGLQGSAPTHPELLDWLARDFVDHGWDVKRTLPPDRPLRHVPTSPRAPPPHCSRAIPTICSSPAAPRVACRPSRSATWPSPPADCSSTRSADPASIPTNRASPTCGEESPCRPRTSSVERRRPVSPQPLLRLEAHRPTAEHAGLRRRRAKSARSAAAARTRRSRRWCC